MTEISIAGNFELIYRLGKMVAKGSPDWLPSGWTVQYKVQKTGRKIRVTFLLLLVSSFFTSLLAFCVLLEGLVIGFAFGLELVSFGADCVVCPIFSLVC